MLDCVCRCAYNLSGRELISLNWFDYVLLLGIVLATIWAIIKSVKNRKNGCSGDCTRCSGCSKDKK
ncbi:MAG: FeoB-associated Cys-rich membrane protein [Clostridia bacterium]|nr:FeoB-associated Cys-rich membrane protein [Clostridia bacterium]